MEEPTPVVDAIPVPEHVRGLLCRIASGWSPAPVQLGKVKQFICRDVDFSDVVDELLIKENRLIVSCNLSSSPQQVPLLHEATAGFHGKCHGMLENGFYFEAETPRLSKMGRSWKEGGAFELRADVSNAFWSVRKNRGENPLLWVGKLTGAPIAGIGNNLTICWSDESGLRNTTIGHYRFVGNYVYYVIKANGADDHYLVVDTSGGSADRKLLWRDLLVMQFVLGCQLRVPSLVGVDSSLEAVAYTVGCVDTEYQGKNSFPPVPVWPEEGMDASWAPLLFERISTAWKARADHSFPIALAMYLDAMSFHLDFDYMRLQVGLESFAYWVLHAAGETESVKDKEAWKIWVKQNEATIRAHAKEGSEDSLIGKVMGVYRLASGRVVPNAFTAANIKMTLEMREELKGRDPVIHQGLMATDGYDIERDLRRIRMVRTMLVALVAKSAGYQGAIVGWELDDRGNPAPQGDWWTVDDADRKLAYQMYIVEMALTDLPGLTEAPPQLR